MIDRRTFLASTPLLAAIGRGDLALHAASPIVGAWCGAVDHQSAIVKVLTKAAGIGMELTLVAEDATTQVVSATADADRVATFRLDRLAERSRYRYAVRIPGEEAVEGGFRTFGDGAWSFRVVFASCAETGSSHAVFAAMQRLQPDLFIHMGDLHYEDIAVADAQRFRRAYDAVLSSPAQSALLRAVPIAYTWDDHDFGPNNSDRTSPGRLAALRTYRSVVPHYPIDGGPDAPICQAFTVGRARFVMTDSRSARDPRNAPESHRTMLGDTQDAWLEAQFEAAASAPLVVWINTVPWITKTSERSKDGWAPYARERRRIADVITRTGLTNRLVMLSGDAHMLALDDGTHSQYSTRPDAPARGFIVAHAAPMDQRSSVKGGPYTHPPIGGNGQFGVLDVTDEGGRVSVRIQGMRGLAPVKGMRLDVTL